MKSNVKQLNIENETKNISKYNDITKNFGLDENRIREADNIWTEVQDTVNVQNVKIPSNLQQNVFGVIREQDEERARMHLSDRDKELLRLGNIYQRKRKGRKYLVLIAAVVAMLALGITSIGEDEKIFESITRFMGGRENTNLNSDDIKPITEITEEEAFQQIEDKYGITPVRMTYLPNGIGLQEVISVDEIQGYSLYYGTKDKVYIKYGIRAKYVDSSWGQDMEDELIDEYEMQIKGIVFKIQQYKLSNGIPRWSVRFEYQDAAYSLVINRLDKTEVEKIIQNFYLFTK